MGSIFPNRRVAGQRPLDPVAGGAARVAGGSSLSRPRFAASLLAALALMQGAACEPARRNVPAPDLAARAESVLNREKALLVEDLGHYALVFSVEQAQLLAFMRQIRVFGDAAELVLGTAQGFEPHGGGLAGPSRDADR